MTKREKALVAIYQRAQDRLLEEIANKAVVGSPALYQQAMLEEVNKILAELQEQSVKWVEGNIPPVYQNEISQAKANTKAVYGLTSDEYAALGKLSQKKITSINRKAVALLVSDFSIDLSVANASLQENIQNVIAEKIATGETVQQTALRIREQIYGTNGQGKISILCKDNVVRNYDPVSYAEMVAKSATTETTNTAAFNETQSVGSKVMGMTEHSPTCNICVVYQGRWYSLDPDYKDYPYIYDTVWKNGRKTVHPRCRHRFFAIILELEDKDYVERMKALSNREFKLSEKEQKMVDRYYKQQNEIREKTRDYQQYRRYIDRLGRDNVPKSFSGFRKMKKSNNDNWKSLRNDYRAARMNVKKSVIPKTKPFGVNTMKYRTSAFSDKEQGLIRTALDSISNKYPINSDINIVGRRLDAQGQAVTGIYKNKNGKLEFVNDLLLDSTYSEKTYRRNGVLYNDIGSTAQHEYLHILNSKLTMTKSDTNMLKHVGQDIKSISRDEIFEIKRFNSGINVAKKTVFNDVYSNVRKDFPNLSPSEYEDLIIDTFGSYAAKDEAEFVCEGISYIMTGKVDASKSALAKSLQTRFDEVYYNANIN